MSCTQLSMDYPQFYPHKLIVFTDKINPKIRINLWGII